MGEDQRKTVLDRVWVWALLYLLLVPAFAIVFQVMPFHSFYDSNIQREPSIAGQANRLSQDLTQAMDSRMTNFEWSSPAGPIRVRSVTVYVAPIQSSPSGLQIDVSGSESGGNIGTTQVGGGFQEAYTLDLSTEPNLTIPPNGPALYSVVAILTSPAGSSFEPPVGLLFPTYGGAVQISDTSAEFYMSGHTLGELSNFYLAAQGDPKTASDPFLRMLYFSVITVTTLGFGDITPVSSAARLAVSVEAILGVVLIGLFLNALGRRIGLSRTNS